MIKTVAGLIEAYKTGKIAEDDILWLDNDTVFVYIGDEDEGTSECVFRSDPWSLMNDLLDIVGIPYSGV